MEIRIFGRERIRELINRLKEFCECRTYKLTTTCYCEKCEERCCFVFELWKNIEKIDVKNDLCEKLVSALSGIKVVLVEEIFKCNSKFLRIVENIIREEKSVLEPFCESATVLPIGYIETTRFLLSVDLEFERERFYKILNIIRDLEKQLPQKIAEKVLHEVI